MSKSILYRWLGLGKIPRAMRPILEREGILLLDEGIGGSVTFRKFKAPGKRYGYRRSWFTGCLVLTRLRFAAWQFGRPLINVGLEPQWLSKLHILVEKGQLRVDFEAGDFMEEASGSIECRFSTDHAERLAGELGAARQGQ